MKRLEVRDLCRACGEAALETVLALGEMPLANALVDAARLSEPEPRYPLTFARCRACALAQIRETVPPERLFTDYAYFSSYSDSMLRHAEQSARELIAELELGPASLVVELASNDGYQLRWFRDAGVPVLGIEPAANVAAAALERGIPTRVEFFGAELARALVREGVRADVLLAYNVLAHVPDLGGFLEGMRLLLAPDGVVVIEVPHVERLLERCEFDTIYHEHLCYFSLAALRPLLARHGLEIFRVIEIPLHGGSLRLYAAPAGARAPEPGVEALARREDEAGLVDGSAYRDFAARVERLRAGLVELVERLCGEGRRIAAYGAAAKGATLLNYAGLGVERIAFVADRSPHKHGRYLPGLRIPIVPAEALARERPDYCVLLAWNLADEVLAQQAEYRRAGGRFILPVPEPRVV